MMRRMLVVDDEETIRWALRELFLQDGWEVHCAADAEQAARLMADKTFDYVVTDLRLPGASGVELVREVRRRNPGAGVTVLTGYGSLESAVEALRLGAWDYVSKPCRLAALKERIDLFPGRDGAGREQAGLGDRDAEVFAAGGGTQVLQLGPFESERQSADALGGIRQMLLDLGLGPDRAGQLIQACVEALAALPERDGGTCVRAGMLNGHALVGLRVRGEVRPQAFETLADRFHVAGRLVRRGDESTLVLAEAI
jgi:DNA-binding response OmpR family regulator